MTYDLNDALLDGRLPEDFFDPGPDPEEEPQAVPKGIGTAVELKDAVRATFEEMRSRELRGGELAGAASGITMVDSALDGWQRGKLYIVGARTGIGKSVFGVNVSCGLAKAGYAVDFLSLEMSVGEQVKRLVACESGVSQNKVKFGKASPYDWNLMTEAANRMVKWDWVIDDRGGIGAVEAAKQIRQIKQYFKDTGRELFCVVVDHLHKLIRGQKFREEITRAVDVLKDAARTEQLCVIALAQISRPSDKQKPKPPTLHDLQESGSIEQEADAVILLHRTDTEETEESQRTNICHISIPKLRDGTPTSFDVGFDGARCRLVNCESRRTEKYKLEG